MDNIKFNIGDFINKKRWFNESNRCNRKTHPGWFEYRPYKRGKNRCLVCGALIGKIRCIRKSFKEAFVEILFTPHPLYKALRDYDKCKRK